jgi:hypothetical protein
MVTDRLSTLGLLFVLSGDYVKYDDELGFPIFRLVRGSCSSECLQQKHQTLTLGELLFLDFP